MHLPLPRAVIDFILSHQNDDIQRLALQRSPHPDIPMRMITQQIKGRQIAKKKYPFLLDYPDYYYPPTVSLEQSTSQIVAEYKRNITSANRLVDLTGGMGIDTYYLSQICHETHYVEPNDKLYTITYHNLKVLGVSRLTGYATTAEQYLASAKKEPNTLYYIDPSRRDAHSRKISIDRYAPDVISLQEHWLSGDSQALIKLSPMQDLTEAMKRLRSIHHIYIISHKNDVKELLIHIMPYSATHPKITAINLDYRGHQQYTGHIAPIETSYGLPHRYLYLPAPAMTKSGLNPAYHKSLDLMRLHPNTNIYTSGHLISDYFGRVVDTVGFIGLKKKTVAQLFPNRMANIVSKNHPLGANQIAKKYQITQGGDLYLVVFTDIENRTQMLAGALVNKHTK